MHVYEPPEIYLLRPDAYTVWSDPVVLERLRWYRSVMLDEKPARFLLAKKTPVDADPYSSGLEDKELWRLHEKARRGFESLFREASEDGLDLGEYGRLETPRYSFLDVKVALARRMLRRCTLCEWRCRVDRTRMRGFCLIGGEAVVHSYFHHMGEEAPLVPSGTIFYGGCNLRCVYCQNWDISQADPLGGERVSPQRLALIQRRLRETGARNINHVGGEPTPHIPFILESLLYLDVNVPQLWNSNMYMSREAMELIRDVIDIWLPDFKYGNDRCAKRLSYVNNYYSTVTRNILEAYRSGGDMIIRHLVLPGHVECCTRRVLEWIARNTPRVLVNIMDQYRPEYKVLRYPDRFRDIARRPTREEIMEAYRIAEELGIVYEPVS